MAIRRRKRKAKLTKKAIASGDEPPDPITAAIIAGVGVAIGAAGTAISATSAHRQARYQSAIAESNALAAERQAAYSRQQAEFNETLSRQHSAKVRGAQRAAIGAAGLDFSGSPLDLLEETAVQSEIEALNIRRQGEYSAGTAEFNAAGSRLQAGAYRRQGNTALTSGLISAGGQLVSGLGSVSTTYNRTKNA